MREASCRILELIERAASVNGIRFEDLVRDLPVPVERLRNRSEWIDWDALAEICDRFEHVTTPKRRSKRGAS